MLLVCISSSFVIWVVGLLSVYVYMYSTYDACIEICITLIEPHHREDFKQLYIRHQYNFKFGKTNAI